MVAATTEMVARKEAVSKRKRTAEDMSDHGGHVRCFGNNVSSRERGSLGLLYNVQSRSLEAFVC